MGVIHPLDLEPLLSVWGEDTVNHKSQCSRPFPLAELTLGDSRPQMIVFLPWGGNKV